MRNPKMLIFIAVGILLFLVLIIVVLNTSKNQTSVENQSPIVGQEDPIDTNPSTGTANVNIKDGQAPKPGILAKVGDEYLYETDLNYELSYYPASNTGEPEAVLFNKMVEDSIILQEAAKEELVKLDETIYNSADKDYEKRIETVLRLKDEIDQKATNLEGGVATIWFHNQKPGAAGYEKGKQLAGEQMKTLLVDLNAGKITIKQAGDRIKANQSLAQVDSSWRGNAYFDFAVSNGQKITYSPDVDKEILKLNKGQTSPILVGKDLDPETGKQIEAVYMIAQVTNRATSQDVSYDKWLAEKKKAYEITRY